MSDGSSFAQFAQVWLPRLEEEMRAVLRTRESAVDDHYLMMQYQMGWVDEKLEPGDFSAGKRVRPLLCLMACAEMGGDPVKAIPAAAAVEILHNFSLVHDDIEDGDRVRRHRPALWTVWGLAQGINVGDGMFALAYRALLRGQNREIPSDALLLAVDRFTRTCVALTEGQYLDLSFENRSQVSVVEYLRMIEGKTASLIAASLAMGAVLGEATTSAESALYQFGRNIGLAFQIRDDILGIWGEPEVTGKAAGNDILRRKKSLPLLYALEDQRTGMEIAALLAREPGDEDLGEILTKMEVAGAREYAQEQLRNFHRKGISALQEALGDAYRNSPLFELAAGLLERER